jgi:uncharacterized delta-60 repeat protein
LKKANYFHGLLKDVSKAVNPGKVLWRAFSGNEYRNTTDQKLGMNHYVMHPRHPCTMKYLVLALAFVSLPCSTALRANTPGELAPSIFQQFGPDGNVWAAAVQRDKRLILGGEFNTTQDVAQERLVRLLPNGQVDRTFRTGGTGTGIPLAIAVQADGKILVGGNFSDFNGANQRYLVRLNRDGSLDPRFVVDLDDDVRTIFVLPNRKILVGGSFEEVNGTSLQHLACLNPNGSLDTSFNTGGSGPNDRVLDIKRLPKGELVIAGEFDTYNGVNSGGIARLKADGSLDTDFVVGNGFDSDVYQVALQKDGKIIAVGRFGQYKGLNRYAYARLNADGSLDEGFNPDNEAWDDMNGVAVLPNGRILVSGRRLTEQNGVVIQNYARLLPNGKLDPSFQAFDSGTGARINGMLPLAGGAVLLFGERRSFAELGEVSVIKFDGKGAIDRKFAGQEGGPVVVNTVRRLVDGSTLLGGTFASSRALGAANVNLAKLRANGKPDTGFNFPSANNGIRLLEVASDGNLFVTGFFTTLQNSVTRNRIAKLQANGQVVPGFDPVNGFDGAALVRAMVPDASGGVYVAGAFSSFNSTGLQNLVRLGSDGKRMTAFATASAANGAIRAMVALPGGDLLIGGDFSLYKSNAVPRLARINGTTASLVDGTVFNPGTGPVFTPASSTRVSALALAQDGGVWLGGVFSSYNGQPRAPLVKINTDGSLRDGFVSAAISGSGLEVAALAEQSDGKLLIGGQFNLVGGLPRPNLARLNANGSLDETFNPGQGPNGIVTGITIENGGTALVVGGFDRFDGQRVPGIARVWLDFRHVATRFIGLGESSDVANRALMGRFTAKLTARGAVSGVLDCPLGKLAVRGSLNSLGRLVTTVTAKNGTTVVVDIGLGRVEGGVRALEGTAISNTGEVVILSSYAAFFSAKNRPYSELAGTYHTSLRPTAPGYFNGSTDLSGFGYLTLRISNAGFARVVGRSSEGAALTAGIHVTPWNRLPLHFDLFKKQGHLQGNLFVYQDSLGVAVRPVAGTLDLLRPAGGGFPTELQQELTAVGEIYFPTAKTEPIFAGAATVAETFTVRILGGHIDVGSGHQSSITIPLNGKAVVSGGSINGLKISFNRKAGTFSGSFIPPSGGKAVKIQGVMIGEVQAQGYALINQGGVVLPAAVLVGP